MTNGLWQVGIRDAAKVRPKGTRARKEKAPPGSKSEHSLQWHVAGLLDKHLAAPAWYTAFPAGGGGEMRGKILKGMGLKSGIPDIWIICPVTLQLTDRSVLVPLLYGLELKKTGKGTPSDAQIATQQTLTLMGVRCANCDNLEQVKQVVFGEWGLPYQDITPTEANFRDNLKNALANV